MDTVFTVLSQAVSGMPVLALGASLLWGVLSLVLSPCHLASIPLIAGFINNQGRTSVRRSFVTSLLFAAGILTAITLIGVITAYAGRMLGDIGSWGNYLVALLFLFFGLILADVIPLSLNAPGAVMLKRRGYGAAFLLGLVFGIALGPCTFAFMAPMLAVSFKIGTGNPFYAVLLLLMYGIGHCLMIVLAGTFTEGIQKYLNWNERSKGALYLKRTCGILVLLAGLYMIYVA